MPDFLISKNQTFCGSKKLVNSFVALTVASFEESAFGFDFQSFTHSFCWKCQIERLFLSGSLSCSITLVPWCFRFCHLFRDFSMHIRHIPVSFDGLLTNFYFLSVVNHSTEFDGCVWFWCQAFRLYAFHIHLVPKMKVRNLFFFPFHSPNENSG